MAEKVSDLSGLDLGDVQERLYEKYDISRCDSQLAVDFLRCFLDAKRAQPTELIILPQIADWAWHELILDTRRYRAICSQVFGRFLHHVAHVDDSPLNTDLDAPKQALVSGDLKSNALKDKFAKSLRKMIEVYGLRLGDHPEEWFEAGWNRPLYRLRNPINTPCHGRDLGADEDKLPNFLSWLPGRLVRRYGMSTYSARQGVQEYVEFFCHLTSRARDARSVLCEIAWEEHILWTQRYAQDCENILGYFLDHSPGSAYSYQHEVNIRRPA